jgi:ABC transport system ATP-binding/permease protein
MYQGGAIPHRVHMNAEKPAAGESAPPLVVRIHGSGRSLPAGPAYLVGRDPGCDIVIADGRVSWRHAVLRVEEGRWVLADNGSTNGIYAGDQRVTRVKINGRAVVRLSHPYNGPALSCTVTSTARAVVPPHPLEIPYAVRWLVPRGERFARALHARGLRARRVRLRLRPAGRER